MLTSANKAWTDDRHKHTAIQLRMRCQNGLHYEAASWGPVISPTAMGLTA